MRYRCRICGIEFTDTMFESARQRALMHAKTKHPRIRPSDVISEFWA